MRSWVNALFPTTDEYKENRMVHFLAEGAVVLILSLIVMLIYNHYFIVNVMTALAIPIAVFISYVAIRHAASGIEFADVTTDKSYKKELKVIFIRTTTWSVVLLGYLLIFRPANWLEGVLLIVSVVLVWFMISFISLKRSYSKNKSLLK